MLKRLKMPSQDLESLGSNTILLGVRKNEKHLFMNYSAITNIKKNSIDYWRECYKCPPPILNLMVVLVQIVLHAIYTDSLGFVLEFQPWNKGEIWRYFTYSLIHINWMHVLTNSAVQLLFGTLLEPLHGPRVILIYIVGVIAGALLQAVLNNATLKGASAGAAAFVLAWIPDVTMNYDVYNYPLLWLILVVLFIIWESLMVPGMTSVQAHISGGIVGFLFGFSLLKSLKNDRNIWITAIPTILGILYLGLLINLNFYNVHT